MLKHVIIQLQNTNCPEILKGAREKRWIILKIQTIRLTVAFNNNLNQKIVESIFQLLRENNCQLRIKCLEKSHLRKEGKMKIFMYT